MERTSVRYESNVASLWDWLYMTGVFFPRIPRILESSAQSASVLEIFLPLKDSTINSSSLRREEHSFSPEVLVLSSELNVMEEEALVTD